MTRERLLERDDELCRLILACKDESEMERLTEEKCVIEMMLMAMLIMDDGCGDEYVEPSTFQHIRAVVAIAERANVIDPANGPIDITKIAPTLSAACEPENAIPEMSMDGEPMGESLNHFEQRMRDRYHYSLGQMDKARECLLRGKPALAMDAIHRAIDGIGDWGVSHH